MNSMAVNKISISFDDPRALAAVQGTPAEARETAAEVQKACGVCVEFHRNEMVLEGEAKTVSVVRQLFEQLVSLAGAGKGLPRADILRALEVLQQNPGVELKSVYNDVLITKTLRGRPITPRSVAQKRYVDLMRNKALVFGVGPAGTGKTFLAVAMGVRKLMDKEVRRIILTRPAIEAGESLGFLPGSFEEKVSPYMRPLYDGLEEMLERARVTKMLETGEIEIAPLAYMRGRTLNDAFVILDEAQNATQMQMKMLLTRIGVGTTAVVTGDPNQVDLPKKNDSGLTHALSILNNVNRVGMARFTHTDVMRHPLVADIIKAYEKN